MENAGDEEKMVFAIRDITKQKEMEKQIMQTERLAGVGQLAAGIAHEIRNPLGNISSAIQFCLEKYKPKEPLNQYLQIVLRNSESANQIIKELLEFANPREIELQSEDIKEILDKAVGLTQTRCEEKKINLIKNYDLKMDKIPVDEKWIQQCFVNFILNAIDAVKKEGEIQISLEEYDDHVIIEFKDNGKGISQENSKKYSIPSLRRNLMV